MIKVSGNLVEPSIDKLVAKLIIHFEKIRWNAKENKLGIHDHQVSRVRVGVIGEVVDRFCEKLLDLQKVVWIFSFFWLFIR